MRDQQLTRTLRFAAFTGFFAAAGSLLHAASAGWNLAIFLGIAAYLLVAGMAGWDRYLSFPVKAGILITLLFLSGIAGLLSLELSGPGLLALFCFCILSAVFFGTAAGLFAFIAGVSSVGVIGACNAAGIINPGAGVQGQDSAVTWLIALVSMLLFAGMAVVAMVTLHRQVEGMMDTLERQYEDLLRKNVLLDDEIDEHMQAEAHAKLLEARLREEKRFRWIRPSGPQPGRWN